MLYMIIERFRNSDAKAVYERFAERGRLAPAGLDYLGSWITEDLTMCYQVMQCEDRTLLDEWMSSWNDLVEFDVVPVIASADARRRTLEQP